LSDGLGDGADSEESAPEPEPCEPPEDSVNSQFDFSSMDPKEEWICFGNIDPANKECETCPAKVECEKESSKEAE
jgi:hypothetical protein